MTGYTLEVILGIIGVLILMAVTINAFFLKGIYSELTFLKVGFQKVLSDQSNATLIRNKLEMRIEKNEAQIDKFKLLINTLQSKIESIENFMKEGD